MNYFKLYKVAVLLFVSCSLIAQKQPDAGMWNTLTIEKEVSKKLTLSYDQEFRLKENFSRINLFYSNVSADYSVFKNFKVSAGYRFIQKYQLEGWFSFRHRLMLDVSYKLKYNDFVFSIRSRNQVEVRDYYSSPVGKIPEWFWRNKFDLKYRIKDFTPYLGTEIRYQIQDPRNPASNKGMHRARMYLGTDYDINKNNSIGLYYLMQEEYDIDDPAEVYIFGLQYTIKI